MSPHPPSSDPLAWPTLPSPTQPNPTQPDLTGRPVGRTATSRAWAEPHAQANGSQAPGNDARAPIEFPPKATGSRDAWSWGKIATSQEAAGLPFAEPSRIYREKKTTTTKPMRRNAADGRVEKTSIITFLFGAPMELHISPKPAVPIVYISGSSLYVYISVISLPTPSITSPRARVTPSCRQMPP